MTANPEVARHAARQAFIRGDTVAGLRAYRQVLALAPEDSDAHAQLAHALERAHDLAAAKIHARAAIALDPGSNIARVALARTLLREGDFAGAEAAALPVAQSGTSSSNDRAVAWGVVGDARDLAGDAAGAFDAFTAANQLTLQKHRALRDTADQLYHPQGVRRMTTFVAHADVRGWRPRKAFSTPAPVFLVGFPRSGTTLLDQILSSHPRISCLEEKDYFSLALAEVFTTSEKLAQMGHLEDEEVRAVRRAYWRHAGKPRSRIVVDKLPLNIVVLPLIKAVFPDARVIVALRDPRDVILSCYQQRFGMNVAMAQLLELPSAAAYYDAVMTLLEVCRQRLDLALHEVRYERVVESLEDEARGLCDFLGAPFDQAMLDYRRTALARSISTPSARQVIQPLYSRSIGRWRRYADQLEPVLPALTAWSRRLGYDVLDAATPA